MLSAVHSNRAWLAESIAFGLAALLFNVFGLITVGMAPGLVLQQSLTGFSLVLCQSCQWIFLLRLPIVYVDSTPHWTVTIFLESQIIIISAGSLISFSLSNGCCGCLYHAKDWEGNTSQLLSCSTEPVPGAAVWTTWVHGGSVSLGWSVDYLFRGLAEAVFPRAASWEGRNCFLSRVVFKKHLSISM